MNSRPANPSFQTAILFVLAFWAIHYPVMAENEKGENRGDSVALVYNSRSDDSRKVALHYASLRKVPEQNIIGIPLSRTETISRKQFNSQLLNPIRDELTARGLLTFKVLDPEHAIARGRQNITGVSEYSIRYLVLCHHVPLRIEVDKDLKEELNPGTVEAFRGRNEAAVDSELATLPISYLDHGLAGPMSNPFYATTNQNLLNPTNGILMVARLDGPNPKTAMRLVDDALEAEKEGLWGYGYFDMRGIKEAGYQLGDQWIAQGAEVSRLKGYDIVLDRNESQFATGYPLSDVAIYLGWYSSSPTGAFAGEVPFRKGAIAYHLFSYSAQSLRIPSRDWCASLLEKGAAATMGCVYEPYLGGTPDLGVFLERFMMRGYSFGEAAYTAQNGLSWQSTIIGDPLYEPFSRPLEERLKSLSTDTDTTNLEWGLAMAANRRLQSGQPHAEVADFIHYQKVTDSSPILLEKVAAVHMQGRAPARAADAFQKALSLTRDSSARFRLMFGLASSLASSGRNEAAIEQLEMVLKDFPDNPLSGQARSMIEKLKPGEKP